MEEIRLTNVAIRFVKYTDASHGYAVFEIGRVSDGEVERLEKAYARSLSPRNGDPTNGTLQKSETHAHLYTVRLCLFVDDVREGKDLIEKVHDNSNVAITYTDSNIRPTLRTIEHGPTCATAKSWFGRYPVDWDQEEEVSPAETTAKKYFFADILCQKIGDKKGVYTIAARSDKTKVIFISTAAEFNQRCGGLCNLISEAQDDRRIYVYDNGAKMGIYTHATYTPYVQDCIEATAEMELPCRAIFEASNPAKLVGMIFICPSYAYRKAGNLPTVQLLDETMIKMCIRDGHLEEEDQARLYKDIEKRSLNEEEGTTMPEETPKTKEIQLRQVAIRVDSSTGRGTTKITIGRLSPNEYNGIKNMIEAYGTGEYRNTWTGRSRDGLHEISFWVHNSIELKNIDIASARIVPNCQSMAVEIVDVRDWGEDPLGSLRERNWFGLESKTFFEVRGVVVCNRCVAGLSRLQIARLDFGEQKRFDVFAGEYGSTLDGQFDKLLTDESIFIGNDRVLKNVSFAAGAELESEESICLSYIKIEKTGNKFKVVAAKRCDEENVEERWHLASAKKDGPIRVTFSNVAVKVTKKVGSLGYYILEIGRLSADELDRLEKVYRNVGDYNAEAHEMDKTKGKVFKREVHITDDDGETWTYYAAAVCVYWPSYNGGSKDMIGKVVDSAEITLESHPGNFRPTLKKLEEREEIHNQYSGQWFERFASRSAIDDPIKIRLNNVVAVAITHEGDYSGIKTTVEFSLANCCNYRQAVDDISEALNVRESEPGRGISWNPSRKLLKVAIQDDVSRIEDMYLRVCPFMIELQYDADNGFWGINRFHEIFGHGGFVYTNPSRRSGKTAELRRMLNAAYGMSIPEGADFDGDVMRYCAQDVAIQTESMWRRKSFEEETMKARMPEITNIEFRDPATIVFWSDGTKTVVRCQNGEPYDPEKGMAMAICRKVYGNERDYYHLFLHWMKKARKAEPPKKDEKPVATKKAPAKKPKTAPKKKGGTKK